MDAKPTAKVERKAVVSRNPEVYSGALVFTGTRVPVVALTDYLKGGSSVDGFLKGHPSVERWQVQAFFDLALEALDPGKPG